MSSPKQQSTLQRPMLIIGWYVRLIFFSQCGVIFKIGLKSFSYKNILFAFFLSDNMGSESQMKGFA